MPFPLMAIAAAVGLGTSIAGVIGGANAANKTQSLQAALQNRTSIITQKIEEKRKLQMRLEALRARREAIRQSVRAQALGLSNAVGQGVNVGASGVQGAMAQERAQETTNLLGLFTGEQIGEEIFNKNARLATTQSRYGTRIGASQGNQAMWEGVTSIGMNILQSSPQIGKIGSSLFGGGANA